MKYSDTMKPEEWTAFIEGFTSMNRLEIVGWLAHGVKDAVRTELGIQLFRNDWNKENKYIFVPFDGEASWKDLDPFVNS